MRPSQPSCNQAVHLNSDDILTRINGKIDFGHQCFMDLSHRFLHVNQTRLRDSSLMHLCYKNHPYYRITAYRNKNTLSIGLCHISWLQGRSFSISPAPVEWPRSHISSHVCMDHSMTDCMNEPRKFKWEKTCVNRRPQLWKEYDQGLRWNNKCPFASSSVLNKFYVFIKPSSWISVLYLKKLKLCGTSTYKMERRTRTNSVLVPYMYAVGPRKACFSHIDKRFPQRFLV